MKFLYKFLEKKYKLDSDIFYVHLSRKLHPTSSAFSCLNKCRLEHVCWPRCWYKAAGVPNHRKHHHGFCSFTVTLNYVNVLPYFFPHYIHFIFIFKCLKKNPQGFSFFLNNSLYAFRASS